MASWDDVKSAITFVGNLGAGRAGLQLGKEAINTTYEVGNYVEKNWSEENAAVDAAKGELAQLKGSGAGKSDQLLECAVPALRFFDNYLPLYNDWKGADLNLQRDIYAKYRRLYGIDFAAFRRDVSVVESTYGVLTDSYHKLDSDFSGLVSTWSGPAAVAASEHISKFLEAGHDFQEDLGMLGKNVGHHVDAMEKLIRLRAELTLELHSPDCGGHIPPSIKQLISMARNNSGITVNNAVGTVMDNFGNVVESAASMVPVVGNYAEGAVGMLTALTNKAEGILNSQFVPAFEAKLQKFNDEVCKRMEQDLQGLWDEFKRSTAECVKEDPFSGVPPLMA